MQAINNNLSSEQFEVLTQKISEIQNLISGNCENKKVEIGIRNDGLVTVSQEMSQTPSKTTEPKIEKESKLKFPAAKNYKFLTENKKQFLFKNINIAANSSCNMEILSGIFLAFKPFELQIQVKDENNEELDCEILGMYIMGSPQLISFDGTTIELFRGNTKIFKKSKQIDFCTFGSSSGQGLNINLLNPYNKELQITILVIGSEDIIDHIGRGGLSESKYLFSKYHLKPNENQKISILAGRIGIMVPKKLQIVVLDNQGKSTNINLLDITHRKSSLLANYAPYKLSTSFFEDPREINLGKFGASENQALVFEFENPTNKDVKVFINLET